MTFLDLPLLPAAFADPVDPDHEAHRLWTLVRPAAVLGGLFVVVRIGFRFSLVVRADATSVVGFRVVNHGPVILASSQAEAASASGRAKARVLIAAAEQVVDRARLDDLRGAPAPVIAADGIASAVIQLASGVGATASVEALRGLTEALSVRWTEGKRSGRAALSIAQLTIGTAVLTAMLDRIGAAEIAALDLAAAPASPATTIRT